MVTGTTTAAKSYYRQYSAGTYGDYGRGDGDLPDRTTGTGGAF
ncbi:23S rRNA (uracil-5-)-methyltransferase rumB [Bacillus cereus Rock3-28]|nr:23S rRNA (uracil-5-)-methyltransferase rumB [Bacillus cereus Rock3-28]